MPHALDEIAEWGRELDDRRGELADLDLLDQGGIRRASDVNPGSQGRRRASGGCGDPCRGGHADADRDGITIRGELGRGEFETFHIAHDDPSQREQASTLVGEHRAISGTAKNLETNLRFEASDALRHRRLAEAQVFRSEAEATVLGDRDEDPA